MSSFLVAFDAVAFFGVAVVVFVMQKTEHDKINKMAPTVLRETRRLFFIATALLLLFAIWDEASYRSLVMLTGGGMLNFVINGIALHMRDRGTPPSGGYPSSWQASPAYGQFGHYISRADVERLDRGQVYTHQLLESILRTKELDPGPAVIPADPVIIHTDKFRPRKTEG
jgi:hypothetical protein